jgi:ATP-dependent Clp protease ATP-binding subunit ClpA
MFERYTEKARRVIFFARHEASQLGGSSIDTEHILLGLFREDKPLMQRLFHSPADAAEAIRRKVKEAKGQVEKLPASMDMPLSPGARRVLSFAADESDRFLSRHIGTEHLLLGILREENSIAADLFFEHGFTVDRVIAIVRERYRPIDWAPETAHGMMAGGVAGGDSSSEEFAAEVADKGGLMELHKRFNGLLDLLVQKGVISEAERERLTRDKDSGPLR